MKKWLFGGAILALAASVIAAVGTARQSKFNAFASMFVPVSALSDWTTVIDAGGVDTADASPLVNPATEIDDSTDHLFDMSERGGTGLVVRLAYRGSVSTSPVIRVFGSRSTSGPWQVLVNRAGDDTATLTVDTTNDGSDGTDKYTTVSLDNHYFDAQGNQYIWVGVQTAQSGGTASVAYIQAKSF